MTAIVAWSRMCLFSGHSLYIPEIVDYELRRELLRANKADSIIKLDELKDAFIYLPLTTPSMHLAAELWAKARNTGVPTADPKRLDVDVILAAQALTLPAPKADVVVATSNAGHLQRFVAALAWTDIVP